MRLSHPKPQVWSKHDGQSLSLVASLLLVAMPGACFDGMLGARSKSLECLDGEPQHFVAFCRFCEAVKREIRT